MSNERSVTFRLCRRVADYLHDLSPTDCVYCLICRALVFGLVSGAALMAGVVLLAGVLS